MGRLLELGPVCHGTRPQYVSWLINFSDNHQIIGAIFKKNVQFELCINDLFISLLPTLTIETQTTKHRANHMLQHRCGNNTSYILYLKKEIGNLTKYQIDMRRAPMSKNCFNKLTLSMNLCTDVAVCQSPFESSRIERTCAVVRQFGKFEYQE